MSNSLPPPMCVCISHCLPPHVYMCVYGVCVCVCALLTACCPLVCVLQEDGVPASSCVWLLDPQQMREVVSSGLCNKLGPYAQQISICLRRMIKDTLIQMQLAAAWGVPGPSPFAAPEYQQQPWSASLNTPSDATISCVEEDVEDTAISGVTTAASTTVASCNNTGSENTTMMNNHIM